MTNPRKPNTPAHARFQMAFKAGRSLEEVRLRGATKRDIRQAIRNHWIEVAAA